MQIVLLSPEIKGFIVFYHSHKDTKCIWWGHWRWFKAPCTLWQCFQGKVNDDVLGPENHFSHFPKLILWKGWRGLQKGVHENYEKNNDWQCCCKFCFADVYIHTNQPVTSYELIVVIVT